MRKAFLKGKVIKSTTVLHGVPRLPCSLMVQTMPSTSNGSEAVLSRDRREVDGKAVCSSEYKML
jgi:hypothetical protein